MTRKVVSLALSLILVGSGTAYAACPNGQVLKRIGAVGTDDGNLISSGAEVHFVVVDCGGTACTAGLYDADTLGASTNAVLNGEFSAAANGTITVDLTDSPLYFGEGITFVDDANVDSIVLFGCAAR